MNKYHTLSYFFFFALPLFKLIFNETTGFYESLFSSSFSLFTFFFDDTLLTLSI